MPDESEEPKKSVVLPTSLRAIKEAFPTRKDVAERLYELEESLDSVVIERLLKHVPDVELWTLLEELEVQVGVQDLDSDPV